ncbi:MAG: ComEC/Rec2 family competence protein [Acidobacteria bacterium]|nr:ComEC/Rec2 family competence protein [Acidobacteriota bacterium]
MKVLRPATLIRLQSDRPVVTVTLFFASGIGLSSLCNRYEFWGLAAAGLILIAASFLSYLRNRTLSAFILAQSAVLLAGMLVGLAHRDGYDAQDLRRLLSRQEFPIGEPVLFEARITEGSPLFGEEIEVVVEIQRFRKKKAWIAGKGKGILRFTIPDSFDRRPLQDSLAPGTALISWAVWKIPRNFENPGSNDRVSSLARRGIFLTGRVKSPRLIESISQESSNPLIPLVNSIRSRVRDTLEPVRKTGDRRAAAIMACLLIGDHSALDYETREIFQNAGSFHILVVSGLHVAWIAGAWLVLAKCMRMPERLRYLTAAGIILLYAWTVGFQAGITRCLWMFLLYLTGRLILRTTDAVNIIFSAALILLSAHPDRLYQTGFQLSFLSVSAIALTAVPAINRWLQPVLQPLKNAGNPDRMFLEPAPGYRLGRRLRTQFELFAEWASDTLPFGVSGILFFISRLAAYSGIALGSMILLSIAVQIWIAPLIAFHFNRISWIAPLSNPIIVPLASLTLASGILAVTASGIAFCGSAPVRFAEGSASLLLNLTEYISGIPGAWQRCPTPPATAILAGILLLFLWKFFQWKRPWVPCGFSIILLAVTSLGSTNFSRNILYKIRATIQPVETDQGPKCSSRLSLTFLDVGEGDSIIIRFPDERLWVLDAGGLRRVSSGENAVDGFDIGEAVVSRYLWHKWAGNPDRVILSHTDIDHAGGIPALLRNFKVGRLDYPRCKMDSILSGILRITRQRRVPATPVNAGMEEKVGPVTVRILHPPSHPARPSTNDNSTVHALSFRHFRALLTGDLEKRGEAELLAHPASLRCLLLKVAHHGSRSGTSSAFLDATQPRWAVVSAGYDNPFGHPSPDVLHRLHRHGVRVYQTSNEGAVTFTTDGVAYEIRSYISGLLESGRLE